MVNRRDLLRGGVRGDVDLSRFFKFLALRPWPWAITALAAASMTYLALSSAGFTFGCIGCGPNARSDPIGTAAFVFSIPAAVFPGLALVTFWPFVAAGGTPGNQARRPRDRLIAHGCSMVILGAAALAMWLPFVFVALASQEYGRLEFVPPIVGLTLLLGLSYQQLLEVLAGITRRLVASAVFLGFYGWLFSVGSTIPLSLLSRLVPDFRVISPQLSYWAAIGRFGNYGVFLPGDSLAIFLGWSASISAAWAVWAWRTPSRGTVG